MTNGKVKAIHHSTENVKTLNFSTNHFPFPVNTLSNISISFLWTFRSLNPGIRFWSTSRVHAGIDIPGCRGLGTTRGHDGELSLHRNNLWG